jgi:hypothetical protein
MVKSRLVRVRDTRSLHFTRENVFADIPLVPSIHVGMGEVVMSDLIMTCYIEVVRNRCEEGLTNKVNSKKETERKD